MSTLSFPQYVQLLKSGRYFPIIKLEVLHPEDESVKDTFVKYPLIGSQLTISNQDISKRTVNLVLDNKSGDYIPSPYNGRLWLNTKIQLSVGVEDVQHNNIFFRQGVFTTAYSNPELVSSPKDGFKINLKMDDKASLMQSQIGNIYQIPANNSILDEMRLLLQTIGDKKPAILENVSDKNPYTLRWSADTTYKTMFTDLRNLFSRDAYYDSTGHFKLESFQDVQTQEVIWNFTTEEVQYMGATQQYMFDKVFNDIYVISSNDSNGAIYTGHATNTDLSSPTSIYAIPKKTQVIQNDNLWSNDLCQQQAEYLLSQSIRVQESINISTMCLPHADVNKAITLTDGYLGLKRNHFSIQQITMPLDMISPMTIVAYRFNNGNDFMDRTSESSNTITS